MHQSEIYALARSAGLPAANAKVAAAVAMAESGGNPAQHTVDSDDDSYGLWQINMRGGLGPDRRRQFGLTSNTDLLQPAVNARVMASISQQGRAWGAWGAYTNGSYKKFLDTSIAGQLADIVPGGQALQDAAAGAASTPLAVIDTATKIGDALNRTTTWITTQQNWVRILYVAGGSVLIIAALGVIARPLVTPLASAVPVGKVAKLLGK